MNDYRILKIIEKNCKSIVCCAIDKKLKRKVAIKKIKIGKNTDQLLHFLSNHQHENICKIFDIFFENDEMNIVMEYSEHDLFSYMDFDYKKDIKHIIRQLVNVVSYLHKEKIGHCDLKPENILIMKDKSIRLIDFDHILYSYRTKYHDIQGTGSYMAPEVLIGLYDERVDLYDIGLITLIMYLGYNPYDIYNIDVETDFSSVPYDACQFILSLMHKDPADRMSIEEAKHHKFLK